MSNSNSLKNKIMIFIVIIITLASGVGTGAFLSSRTKTSGGAVAAAKPTTNQQAAIEDGKSAEEQKKVEEDAKKLEEQKKAEEAKAAEEQKKAEEAKAAEEQKKAEEAKAQETSSQNTSTTKPASNTTQNSAYPKAIAFETGVRIVESKQQEDAKTGVNIISSDLAYTAKSGNVNFKVATIGTNTSIPYKATIHLKSGDVVYKGTTSSQVQSLAISSTKVPVGSKVVVDFESTYKGKVYRFSNSFVRN